VGLLFAVTYGWILPIESVLKELKMKLANVSDACTAGPRS
jgi:hypothetical protein